MSEGASQSQADTRAVGRLLGYAVLVGIVVALLATAFSIVVHELEHVLWETLPQALGHSEAPGWLVVVLLLTGAVLTWAASQLPGGGGHPPLDGLRFDIGPRQITSTLLAALASLAFGAVVGPEAPLMAIGTATAVFVASRAEPTQQQVLMLAGAMAGMGTIFGNPLVTAILLLESAALTGGSATPQAAMTKLLPALLALGAGYLVQVGFGAFPGVGETVLAVPGLPAYPDVQGLDLALSVPLALGVALVCVAALRLGDAYRSFATGRPLPAILLAGGLVAALTLGTTAVTDTSIDLVLFSGQAAMPQMLALTAGTTALLIVAAKAVAYALSIGGGFRGGMVFPGVFIGVAAAVACVDLVPDANLAAMSAAGIGAAVASILRLPFTAVLLAVLLCAGAGLAVTTGAIVAAIVGLFVRLGLDRRLAPAVGSPSDQPAAA